MAATTCAISISSTQGGRAVVQSIEQQDIACRQFLGELVGVDIIAALGGWCIIRPNNHPIGRIIARK
jgi:hypothetical protein